MLRLASLPLARIVNSRQLHTYPNCPLNSFVHKQSPIYDEVIY